MLIDARVASGLRDLPPSLAKPRERLVDQFRRVFRSFGFQPIETPHIERKEVLTGKGAGSEEVLRQIFDVVNTGGTLGELALRFDHTVPLARFVAAHINEIGLPFKRFAIGSVFRGERPAKGRFREFTQCDFDIVGTEGVTADAEIVMVIYQALTLAEVPRSTIWLNHRGLLEALLDGISARDRGPAVLRAIDKLSKIGREQVAKELTNPEKGAGLTTDQADHVLDFIVAGRGALLCWIKPKDFLAITIRLKRRFIHFVQSVGCLMNRVCPRMPSCSTWGWLVAWTITPAWLWRPQSMVGKSLARSVLGGGTTIWEVSSVSGGFPVWGHPLGLTD